MESSEVPPEGTVVTVFGLEPLRIGGVESFAREFSMQLAQRGRRSVLCFLAEPAPPVRAYLDLPNVTIEVLPNPLRGVASLAPVRRILRRYRPEVLLLQFTPFLSAVPWVARLSGVRRVYFVDQGSHPEGWEVRGRAPLWKRRVARILTLPLSAVVSISDYNLRVLRSRGFMPESRTVRIYNAADTSRGHDAGLGAAFRVRHGIPSDRVVVAQVSWMIPEKGIPDLLESARLALARCPQLHFVLAGEGPLRSEYQVLAVELGLEGRVTWTGLVRDPRGEGLFDAADIVCQMSRWEEAFGYVIAEAMAVSRPVVATRVGAIPELVANGDTGFLVDRGDSAAAAEAILKLATDLELRRRMGAAGRARAEALFNVRTNVEASLRVFGLAGLAPAQSNGTR